MVGGVGVAASSPGKHGVRGSVCVTLGTWGLVCVTGSTWGPVCVTGSTWVAGFGVCHSEHMTAYLAAAMGAGFV